MQTGAALLFMCLIFRDFEIDFATLIFFLGTKYADMQLHLFNCTERKNTRTEETSSFSQDSKSIIEYFKKPLCKRFSLLTMIGTPV